MFTFDKTTGENNTQENTEKQASCPTLLRYIKMRRKERAKCTPILPVFYEES